MSKKLLRKILLILVLVLEGTLSIGYSHEIYKIVIKNEGISGSSQLMVDGTDFSPLVDLMVSVTNEINNLISIIFCIAFTTVCILLMAILLSVTMIRKDDMIDDMELKFAIRAILISSLTAILLGILFSSIHLFLFTIALSWQQPVFMSFIYYIRLKRKSVSYKK